MSTVIFERASREVGTGLQIVQEGWHGAHAAGARLDDMRQTLYTELMGRASSADYTRAELAAMVVMLIEQNHELKHGPGF